MTSFFKSGLIRSGLLLALTSYAAFGQQTSDLPLGALPMQYNGSFAGEAGSPRISSNFGFGDKRGYLRRQYYHGSFRQQITYDQFVPALSTGVGVGIQAARQATETLRGFSVAVAPKISLNGKYTLSPSLSLEHAAVHSPTRGVLMLDSMFVPGEYRSNHWLGRAGLLFNTDKFYAGYSVDIVDYQTYRYVVNGPREARRMDRFNSYLQLGYTFQRSEESHFSITSQVAFYIGHGDFARGSPYERFEINVFQGYNLTFRYKQFIWGINNTGLHAGWQGRRLKVMAGNVVTFEDGVHWHHVANLSLRYVFRNDKG